MTVGTEVTWCVWGPGVEDCFSVMLCQVLPGTTVNRWANKHLDLLQNACKC